MPQKNENPTCASCGSTHSVRRGYRKKKRENLPLYLCKSCGRTFTKQILQGKTYPLKIIFEALCLYHLGYTLFEVSKRLKSRSGLNINKSTLSTWTKEFKDLCSYGRLRGKGIELYSPNQVLYSTILHHKQVYRFQYHRPKLQLLLEDPAHQHFQPLKTYLESATANCPNKIFQGETRSSSVNIHFSLNQVQIQEKSNYAVRLAQLALQVAPNNKARHSTLQRFMLVNDSVTVATEVPVYLMPTDLYHLQGKLKFDIPFKLEEPLTGHIDLVQIRNKAIHILDYKPKAEKEKPYTQLTLYALALSRLTGLRLYDFKCAWFDENNYFEFFPLHMVYKLNQKR